MPNTVITQVASRTVAIYGANRTTAIVQRTRRIVASSRGPQGIAGRDGADGTDGGLIVVNADTDQDMACGSCYIANSPSARVQLTMPVGSTRGDEAIEVWDYGDGGFTILVPNGVSVRVIGGPSGPSSDGSGYIVSSRPDSDFLALVRMRPVALNTWNAEVYACNWV